MVICAMAGLLVVACGLRYELRRYQVMRRWRRRHYPS